MPPRPGIDYLPDNFEPPPATRPAWRQLLVFVVVFCLLQGAWLAARGSTAERIGVDLLTAAPAAAAIRVLTPALDAEAVGPRIRAPGGGINILYGCEGFDVFFLLVAALVAAPLSLRARLGGLLLGAILVWLANQARVISLFYSYRADKELFATLHGTVMPLLIVALVSAWFLLFLARTRRP